MELQLSDPDEDADRYPTLSEVGAAMLRFLTEHPAAPVFRQKSGNRLLADEVEVLRAWEREVLAARVPLPQAGVPGWLPDFVAQCLAEVPHYRAYGARPDDFAVLPTVSRGELARDVARFVPDSVPLERLMHFQTSGTTGHPMRVPSHPVVAGRYLAFHKKALRRFGIEPVHGRGQVGVVLLGFQRACFTYVSVTPTMDESGLVKLNLHPDDWRSPDDRARYLDALAPEIVSGDPLSFVELLELPVRFRPKALMSFAMALSPGLRAALEARFECPVLDIYSLNEVGPVGVFDGGAGGHVLLQFRLHVELLDSQGNPVAPGERGEITVTGGFNHCLPLLRYRTGDWASIGLHEGEPVLLGLSGRAPVRFRTLNGAWINNVDVSHALGPLRLAQFGLRQAKDGSLTLRLNPGGMAEAELARQAIWALLGAWPLRVETIVEEDKIVQYASELEGALP